MCQWNADPGKIWVSLLSHGDSDQHFTQLILTFVGSCVYNLWFHPLSAFPGPKWAAVSSLWTIRRWLSGNYVHEIEKLHNQYGVVVRTAPNQLSFNSGSSWKD